MGNTFGGEHHRLGTNGHDPQRGNSRRQLQDYASFDNEPATGCFGCLLFALTILATAAAAIGLALA